jgi:hypothetical protein
MIDSALDALTTLVKWFLVLGIAATVLKMCIYGPTDTGRQQQPVAASPWHRHPQEVRQ